MSDFDDLLGKGKAKKGGGGRKRATYLRYDPDTGEKKRVTREDDEYDEWLTAAQWRKEQRDREGEAEEAADEADDGTLKGFAKDVGKDILKDLKRTPRRGRKASPAQRRKAAKDVKNITRNLTGKSVLTKVAPLAARLGIAAATIGAIWWATQTLEARAVRKRVEAEIAGTEARLKRPLTEKELAALLPQYQKFFTKKLADDRLKRFTSNRV